MKTSWEKKLALLLSIVRKAELEETTKWGIPVFTYNGKNVVGIAGFKSYVALWFYNGIFLKDKHKVLVNTQEGVTKALRQWRFYSCEEIDTELVLEYVYEAVDNEKQGKRLIPRRKDKLPVPPAMAAAFKADKNFEKCFEALTLGKQNEYIEHIQSAKREVTQLSRIAKIKPLIMQKKGLHDKYKK